MKKTILGLLAGMILSAAAYAGGYTSYTHQRIGNMHFWNGSDGQMVTGQRIGNIDFYHDNRGNSWTVHHLGEDED